MPIARARHVTDPDSKIGRFYVHSGFGGPFPPINLELREIFLRRLYEVIDFNGARVLAFSLQPTEFHLIIEEDRDFKPSKKEMLRRLQKFAPTMVTDSKLAALKAGDPEAWRRLETHFGGISEFMKRFKASVTRHYHRLHDTSGSIWRDRFNSVVLQPGHTSRVVAAWIHHASVRRGVVDRPDDDIFTTFGRAVSGDKRAREMVAALFAETPDASWRKVAATYRRFIATTVSDPVDYRPLKHIQRKPLTRPELLNIHVPNFTEGGAIGDRGFIERVFTAHRHHFGEKRKDGARFVRGQDDPDLWTLRQKPDLRRPYTP